MFLSVVLPFSSRFWLLAFCFGCFCAEEKSSADSNLDPELFCAFRGEGSRALGNPGARFVSDWFQQKTIKVFLIGLFKCARERLNVRRVWRGGGFFPRHLEVNTAGRFLKTTFERLIRQNYWIFQFSNKIA